MTHQDHCNANYGPEDEKRDDYQIATPGPWETSGVRVTGSIEGPFLQVLGPKGVVAFVPYSDKTMADHVESHADQRQIAAAPAMLKALIEVSVFAEMQIEDICADIQEGGELDAVAKMELARWQSVGDAIRKATSTG